MKKTIQINQKSILDASHDSEAVYHQKENQQFLKIMKDYFFEKDVKGGAIRIISNYEVEEHNLKDTDYAKENPLHSLFKVKTNEDMFEVFDDVNAHNGMDFFIENDMIVAIAYGHYKRYHNKTFCMTTRIEFKPIQEDFNILAYPDGSKKARKFFNRVFPFFLYQEAENVLASA